MILKPVLGTQLQLGHPLASGIVGYWLMNEGAGSTANDLSGNGKTGALIADASWVPGKFGPAASLDGVGDRIECGPVIPGGSSALSVAVWARNNRALPSGANEAVLEMANSGGNKVLSLWMRVNGKFNFRVYNSAIATGEAQGATIFDDNDWHFIVGTWDGALVRIFIDAISEDASPAALTGVTIASPDDLKIGGQPVGGAGTTDWDGDISHVQIYNRALSATEIAELYRDPFAMFQQEPIELWTAATSVGAPTGLSIPIAMHHYKQMHGAA